MQSGNPGKLSEGLIISRTNVASVVSAVKSIQNSGTSILKGAGGGRKKNVVQLVYMFERTAIFRWEGTDQGGA